MVKIRVVNPLAETTLVQLFFDNLTGTLDKDALVINKRHEQTCPNPLQANILQQNLVQIRYRYDSATDLKSVVNLQQTLLQTENLQ